MQIRQPEEVRRNILETLKMILKGLHSFEKFKSTRHEKLEHINRLRRSLREANKLLGVLKARLPQTGLKPVSEKPAPIKKSMPKKQKPEAKPQKAPKREMTEIEKLESELGAIESKLREIA